MLFSLQDKTAVITGGGSGIGRAIALLFAQQGARVHVLELNADAATEVIDTIHTAGGWAMAHTCNVADHAEVVEVLNKIGAINILVNNAGIAQVGNLEQTSASDFDKILAVNVKGVYNCMYAVLPMMKAQGSGVILNMASIAALVGIPDRFAYSASKGAVIAMTQSVAKDYLKANIRCNSISPARVHTPFVDGFINRNYAGKEAEMFEKLSLSQPIGRMAKPEEIAFMALYLCSEEASFVTGNDYPIDGGFVKLNN
jgi:NAD(P)-dependent dehydrogenase (short-subunit alcohol dehydrogenase family)